MLQLLSRGGQIRHMSVKFRENFNQQASISPKPRLRDFRYPLANTFLMASSTFMALNALWYGLEYSHVENALVAESLVLEAELKDALDNARDEMVKSERRWYSRLKFWKT